MIVGLICASLTMGICSITTEAVYAKDTDNGSLVKQLAQQQEEEKIVISKKEKEVTLQVDKAITIKTNKKATWKVSNKKIVKIKKLSNKKISITGKKKGTCTLTAKYGKVSKKIKVTVKAKKKTVQTEPTPLVTPTAVPSEAPVAPIEPIITKMPGITPEVPSSAPTLEPSKLPDVTNIPPNVPTATPNIVGLETVTFSGVIVTAEEELLVKGAGSYNLNKIVWNDGIKIYKDGNEITKDDLHMGDRIDFLYNGVILTTFPSMILSCKEITVHTKASVATCGGVITNITSGGAITMKAENTGKDYCLDVTEDVTIWNKIGLVPPNARETLQVGDKITAIYHGGIAAESNQETLKSCNVIVVEDSGVCGEHLTWRFYQSTETLVISGTGRMYDYTMGAAPWDAWSSKIKSVSIQKGVEGIGANAFSTCSAMRTVAIADDVTFIAPNAFSLSSKDLKFYVYNNENCAKQFAIEQGYSYEYFHFVTPH